MTTNARPGQTKIMAIINVSPDSFSGDGSLDTTVLRQRIVDAIQGGADILDIGGQSTRPGATVISIQEELDRVLPIIRLSRELTDLPLSIDTFKPAVAEAAVAAGASIINDIHGCSDPAMVEVVAQSKADVVVMHSRGTPETMSQLTDYPNGLLPELIDFFKRQTALLITAGVTPERIILDPGIGFAKTPAQSFEATRDLAQLQALGFRLLYGSSMKSFLGHGLAHVPGQPAPVEARFTPTVVTHTYALLQGINILRVHDVLAAVRVRRTIDCILHPDKATAAT